MTFKEYVPFDKNRFYNHALTAMPNLDESFEPLLKRMGALIPDWHYHAVKMMKTMSHDGEIKDFLTTIAELLDELGQMGFGMNPPWKVVNTVYMSAKKNGLFNGSRLEYCLRAYRLVERIGSHLLVQRSEQSCVSKHGLELIKQHIENGPRTIYMGREFVNTTYHANLLRKRYAERILRISGLRDFCLKDLNWKAINITITPPSFFNPGYGSKTNQEWINAGCPSARDSHNWISQRFNAFLTKCRNNKVKVYGYRTVEGFNAMSAVHWHIQLYVCSDYVEFVALNLSKIMGVDYEYSADTPVSNSQALHLKVSESNEDAEYWSRYIDKDCFKDNRHFAFDSIDNVNHDTEEVSQEEVLHRSDSQQLCFLIGVDQYQFIGTQPIKYFRIVSKINREILNNTNAVKFIPDEVLKAFEYAGGTTIVDGKIVKINKNYRAWLRLTEPIYRELNPLVDDGAIYYYPDLRFQSKKQSDHMYIDFITRPNYDKGRVYVKVPIIKHNELVVPIYQSYDMKYLLSGFNTKYLIELCILQPTWEKFKNSS